MAAVTTRTSDAVAAVASAGLVAPGGPVSPVIVSEASWTRFLMACEEHRVLGLLPVAERLGLIDFAEYQRSAVELRLRHWLSHDLAVERMAQAVVGALEVAGIEYRLLKGVVLANSLYPDPSMRVFSDVDVLVRSSEFTRAANLIAASPEAGGLGALRALPELRPGFDDRFGREVLLRSGSIEIDLHRTLVDGPYGLRVNLQDLFDAPRTVTLGGQEVLTVGRSAQFLHACFSAVLGEWPPRLMVLRDVVELLGSDRHAVDAAEVLQMAGRWRAQPVVALAVNLALDTLRAGPRHDLVGWARGFAAGPVERLLLRTYRGRARGYTSQLASLAAVPGLAQKASFLHAITRPSPEYLRARGFRRGERVRRALGLVKP